MILLVIDPDEKLTLKIKVKKEFEELVRKLNNADLTQNNENVLKLRDLIGGTKGLNVNPELGKKINNFILDKEYITFWWIL